MSGIDNRIVMMTFDNESFERNLAATIQSLDDLSKTIELASAKQGLTDVAQAADSFDASSMSNAVQNISDKFSVLGAVGFTVIQDLTRSALDFGVQVTKSLVEPLLSGGKRRAENIEQAKFMFRGLSMDIENSMESARLAVTGTAYGLDSAAKAASQLGGSGLKAGEEMTSALRGIAGIAAMTNSSYDEMADIFVSAAGNGKVMSMELARISHRGVNAAAALAKEWGITEAEVRSMATNSEISFEMFYQAMDSAFGEHATKANETYTGSLSNMRAALARIGAAWYGPQMLQQRDLFNAMSPVIDKVNEALQPLIVSLLELRGIGIQKMIGFLENLDLTGFTEAMPNFAKGLKNVHQAVNVVFGAIGSAFRSAFPKSNTSIILSLSEAFLKFSESIKMGGRTIENIRRTFEGFFSVLRIGWEIVKELGRLVFDLLGEFTGFGGGLLEASAGVGDFLVGLRLVLVEGGAIRKFFEALGRAIRHPIQFIKDLKDALVGLFKGDTAGDAASGALSRLGERLSGLHTIVTRLGDAWRWLMRAMAPVIAVLKEVGDVITTWFKELGGKLADALDANDFNAIVDIINVGLLGGIAAVLTKFFRNGLSLDFSGGMLSSISEAFGELTGILSAMQTEIKANALLKIASAVAILTVSVVALSLIDSVALTKAMIALGVGFGQLITAMSLMSKVSTGIGSVKIGLLAAGMIVLATAATVLSIAITVLSRLSWNDLAKGLVGVMGGLIALTTATKLITTNTKGLFRAGLSMIAMSVALLVLAKAVKSFAGMSWTEMGKGLVGVAGGLAILTTATNFMPKGMISKGLGLVIIAAGLRILATSVRAFSEFNWTDMGRGMAGMAGALVVIAGAMHLMPKDMILMGAGLLIVAQAIKGLASAIAIMGGISWGEMAKGIAGIAGVLGVLAIAMKLMSTTITGAASLIVVALGLSMLAGALDKFANLGIASIATGLGALAATLGVLGVAGWLLAPLIPAMLGLGAALTLVGAGLALFGVGASLVAGAFVLMASAGVAGAKAIVAALEILSMALPKIAAMIALSIVAFGMEILEALPTIVKIIGVVLSHILDTVVELVPKIVEALSEIITGFLTLVKRHVPELIETGFLIITSLLTGIRDNIGEITVIAVDILVNFAKAVVANMDTIVTAALDMIFAFVGALISRADDIAEAAISLLAAFVSSIASNVSMLITAAAELVAAIVLGIAENIDVILGAGADFLISFLQGISDNINKVLDAIAEIITTFVTGMADRAVDVAKAGTEALASFLKGMSDNFILIVNTAADIVTELVTALGNGATKIVKAGTTAIESFLKGLANSSKRITKAGADVVIAFINGLGNNSIRIVQAAFDMIIKFMNALATAIDKFSGEFRSAGLRIAGAIADGMTFGLASKAGSVAKSAVNVAKGALGSVTGFLGISSPSKVFMEIGQNMAEGMAIGLSNDETAANSAVQLAESIVNNFRDTITKIPDSIADIPEFQPTIRPVLDLSEVERGSKGLDKMLSTTSLTANVSTGQANLIAHTTAPTAEEPSQNEVLKAPNEVKFEQHIYSPTALSTNDIYRNTRSQIILAKEELNIP